ncbi:transcriptional regulator [human gut metagenome]|uniref:Transcriptional regulator n=1 Tax=human gut metagenome TaxID=408170 RepID=K1UU41_9ZZZZ
MADEKLNTGPAENISPEAAEPITTPEQAAASEPQQEQTGPAIPEPGDVVVSFDKINELMAEKRQNARAEVEKAETPRNAGGGSPRRNTAARQYGGAEKAAPWSSTKSRKGRD